jgi:membrane dipeptidase
VHTVADHIDHISALVGTEHIAIGSDFDGIFRPPEGLEDCAGMPNLTIELIRRGYSEREVRNILGENFMRVFSRVSP